MFNPMNRETLNKFYQRLRDRGFDFEVKEITEEEYQKLCRTPIPFCDLGVMTQRALLEIKKGDKNE